MAAFDAQAADVCASGCTYTSIQSAITAAASGATITVDPGTYHESIVIAGNKTVTSTSGAAGTIIDATGLGTHAVQISSGSIVGLTITGGNATNGGGIYITGSGTVRNNIITGNTASSNGGGIWYSQYTNVNIQYNTIQNNTAGSNGGGIALNAYPYSQVINANILSGNHATNGGGIFAGSYSDTRLTNLLITKNTAQYGGGIYMTNYSYPVLINSTLSANSATSDGGGIFTSSYAHGTVINAILWVNGGADFGPSSPSMSMSYTIAGTAILGTGNSTADPLFADSANGNYHVAAGSPAIDLGTNTSGSGVTSDLDGTARPQDGDGLGAGSTGDGSDYDIGTYEYVIPLSSLTITINSPPNGYITNSATQTITGTLSKTASLTVNGATVTVAADHSFSLNVALSEGANNLNFIATAAGGEAVQKSLSLVLDTQPPAVPQNSLISMSNVAAGSITVTGATGSVEAGAYVVITNARTGQVVIVTADSAGAFTASIGAQGNDILSIYVSDVAGNTSGTIKLTAYSLDVSIQIPGDGATFQTDSLVVKGHYDGPVNIGVTVNDVTALTDDAGNFMANISLANGSNAITATVKTLYGQSTSVTTTVSNSFTSPLLTMTTSSVNGPAPLQVTFAYQYTAGISISQVSIDFDGDGINDVVGGADTSSFQHTYTDPGLYEATITILDNLGQIYHASALIQVISPSSMDARIGQIWNGMNSALLAGDAATASIFLTSEANERYGRVFATLLPDMSQIIGSYSPLQRISISGDLGEYAINRIIDGNNQIYFIYYIKCDDGIWRIDTM